MKSKRPKSRTWFSIADNIVGYWVSSDTRYNGYPTVIHAFTIEKNGWKSQHYPTILWMRDEYDY